MKPYLDVESGGGRHKTNRYRPILLPSETRTQESVFNEETRTHESAFSQKPGLRSPETRTQTPADSSDDLSDQREEREEEDGATRPSSPDGASGAAPSRDAEAWPEFQRLMKRPWRDKPDKVKAAFNETVAKHGVDAVMAGAKKWSEAREPRYRPEPIAWLLDGDWQSDPPPTPQSAGTSHGHGYGQKKRAASTTRGKSDGEIAAEAMLRAAGVAI